MNVFCRLITVLLSTVYGTIAYSQNDIAVNENIQIFLKDYLNNVDDPSLKMSKLKRMQSSEMKTCDTAIYAQFDLLVWDLLSNKSIHKDHDMNKIGIYGFRDLSSDLLVNVLIKYCDDYEILPMTEKKLKEHRDFLVILDDLQSYFVRHPNLDRRLLPLYNKAVLEVYIANTRSDELGDWFDWYKTEQNKFVK